MNQLDLQEFAARYTEAWCSQDAGRVASFYSPSGALTINGGAPSVGRDAITKAAQGFMTAFPGMVVSMDGLDHEGDKLHYRWTLDGTNSGPGGKGHRVRISGWEEWTINEDGLLADSQGHFDAEE